MSAIRFDGQRQVAGQDAGVVGGVVARGVGVERAADGLDLLGDGAGGAGGGALERHVLEQVGDAVHLGRLVAGADIDPDAHGQRVDARHGLADDPDAVGQRGQAGFGRGHAASGRVSRIPASTAPRSLGRRRQRSGRSCRSREGGRQVGLDAGGLANGVGELGGMGSRQGDERDAGRAAARARRPRDRPPCAGRPARPWSRASGGWWRRWWPRRHGRRRTARARAGRPPAGP